MKGIKVKLIVTKSKSELEQGLNKFINEDIADLDLIDIKFAVDPEAYYALVLYK